MGIDNDFDERNRKVMHFLSFFSSTGTGFHLPSIQVNSIHTYHTTKIPPLLDKCKYSDGEQALDLAIQIKSKTFQGSVF